MIAIDMAVGLLSCKIVLEGGPHKLEFLSLSVLSDSFSGKFCFIVLHPILFVFLIIFVLLYS